MANPPPQIAEYVKEIRDYFKSFQRFKVGGLAGLGRHGGALLMAEKDDQGKPFRKLVVKFSLGQYAIDDDDANNADEDLMNEVKWLKMLRGAEHVSYIGQLIHLAETSVEGQGLKKNSPTLSAQMQSLSIGTSKDSEAKDGESKKEKERRIPLTFALEYLEGGTIRRLGEDSLFGGALRTFTHLDVDVDDGMTWACLE
ncbi:hypothetical protein F5Y18DRAFT_430101 [Xylariaceae sp. FL1019]|nr:hypothetical protein F5Y18DRAFT_430101 [Xylariaceae sp. FL1019]